MCILVLCTLGRNLEQVRHESRGFPGQANNLAPHQTDNLLTYYGLTSQALENSH